MTAEEIREKSPENISSAGWLKEIAYQLALLNESMNQPEPVAIPDEPEPAMCWCGKKKGHVGRHAGKEAKTA